VTTSPDLYGLLLTNFFARCSVGDTAKQAFHTMPSQTVFNIKRLIGRKYSDAGLQEDVKLWPFEVVDRDGKPAVRVLYEGNPKEFVSTRAFCNSFITIILTRIDFSDSSGDICHDSCKDEGDC
jgi:hypothetical protein